MNIAVIPARGGSKRIPKKNIKDFCGKPMIAYSIKAAISTGLFQDIIVSTDSEEIARVSKEYGANVPFTRPAELADDIAGTWDVMAHAVNWFQQKVGEPSAICCIYATAPFIQKDDLISAYDIFETNKWSFVFSATKFSYPIQRAFMKLKSGGIKMLNPKHYDARSQDLMQAYHDAGQFYWGKPSAWLNGNTIFDTNSAIIELPIWRVHDIDTHEDWKRAEMMKKISEKRGLILNEKEKIDYYLKIIDGIEQVRSKNNMNWMDILRLAFKHSPKEARALMKKIDHEDNQISKLVKKLSE